MAKANVMIDNQKTRVTEWTFEIGDETGQHIHEYDYVVVPMLDGELKIWVGSASEPALTKKFNKQVNIYDVQKVLASHIK